MMHQYREKLCEMWDTPSGEAGGKRRSTDSEQKMVKKGAQGRWG